MAFILDQDAVVAAADLVGRSGARELEVGWHCPHPDPPDDHTCPHVTWHAQAGYLGAHGIVTTTVTGQPGPVEAVEALARKLLTGAKCRCGRLVALSDDGAVAHLDAELIDGTTWTVEQAAKAGQCRWTRHGQRWEPSCDAPPIRKGPW